MGIATRNLQFHHPVRSALALAALCLPLATPAAHATTYTWNATASGNWTAAANWSGNVAPPASDLANTDIVFGASSSSTSIVDASYGIHSLTFNAATNGYNVTSPYSLTLGPGGLTQLSAQTQVLPAVNLATDQTWTLGNSATTAAGLLNLSAYGIITNGHVLTLNVPYLASLKAVIQGNNGVSAGLIKTGAGALTLVGPSSYAGVTHVDVGTLTVGDQSLLGAVLVNSGSTLTFTGTGGLLNSPDSAVYAASYTASNPSVVNLSGTGTIYSNGGGIGVSGGIGVLNQTGGSLRAGTNGFGFGLGNAASSGTYNLMGGDFTGTSPYANTQVVGYNGVGIVNQSGGTFTATPLSLAYTSSSTGTYNLNGGVLNTGSVVGGDGASVLNLKGGVIQPTADSTSFFQGLKTINVRRGGAVFDTFNKAITINQPLQHSTISGDPAVDGGLIKTDGGILTLTAGNTYNGGTTVMTGGLIAANDSSLGAASGSVTLSSDNCYLTYTSPSVTTARRFYLANGRLSPASGGSITYNASSINGGILGAGTHNLGNSTTLYGTRTTTGTALVQTGGPITLQNVTFGGNTTFSQTSPFTFLCYGEFVALPLTTINLSGPAAFQGGYIAGALNIAANAQVNESNQLNSVTPLYLDGSRGTTVSSGGQLNAASGSTIELGGLLTNNGTQTGTLNVNLGGIVMGTGKFGTVNLAAMSVFNAAGTISGGLVVANGATVSLSGNGQALMVNGALTNNGTMRFDHGATLTAAGGANSVVNNGVIDTISGGLSVPAGFTNNGLVLDSSVTKVKAVTRAADGSSVTLQIDAYPGHSYKLQRSDSLTSGSFADVQGVPVQSNAANNTTPVTLTFTDAAPAAAEGFYRVQVDS